MIQISLFPNKNIDQRKGISHSKKFYNKFICLSYSSFQSGQFQNTTVKIPITKMKDPKNQSKKPISKNTQSSASKTEKQKQKSPSKQKRSKSPIKKEKEKEKFKMDFIKKDNFDNFHTKINITQIKELPIKYTLHCIEGIYKNRFLYITTHVDGEVFGSGNAKTYGLTLQIEGAGLSPKHAQLKFDGFKNFDVIDFDSENGTWMNIPKQGVDIKNNQSFSIGPYIVNFTFGYEIDQIEQICMTYHVNYLSEVLTYNGISSLPQLYAAEYTNFKGFPFQEKQIEKIKRISNDTKKWFQEGKDYRRLIAKILNQPHKDFEIQIGWDSFYFGDNPDQIFYAKNVLAEVSKGRILPVDKVFAKIIPNKSHALSLHSQLKLGNLMFELNRFNTGKILDKGSRSQMQDGLLIQQDVGGSEWKLISLFAVFDGHGGPECMEYFRDNLLAKIRQWTAMLDEAGDLNQMVKVLMNKTFFDLDLQFYQKFPQVANTCGCTCLVVLLIERKAYVFSLGDCKGFLFRNDTIYQMSLDHLPSRGDQRSRIENAGGFIQYDRLMGKCTLSRAMGQFEYKNIDDYTNKMKGPQKSYLSCIPDLVTFDINPQTDDFLLISTDGLLQSLNIGQITDFIMERYSKLELEQSPNKILSSLAETSKVMSKDSDNTAAILIILRKGLVGSKKSW